MSVCLTVCLSVCLFVYLFVSVQLTQLTHTNTLHAHMRTFDCRSMYRSANITSTFCDINT